MNELLAVGSFVLLGMSILAASRLGQTYLFVLSAFIIIASNITVGIQVDVFGVSISWAVIIYSLVYLITDILSEFHEKYAAYKLALCNVVVQILFWIYLFISIPVVPSAGIPAYESMQTLFATTPRVTIAALVASLGAFADIAFYEWLRDKFRKSDDDVAGYLWLRNNLSTWVGQSINTALFFTIALYGVLPNLLSIILSAIAIKWAIAILDTPILYMAKRVWRY